MASSAPLRTQTSEPSTITQVPESKPTDAVDETESRRLDSDKKRLEIDGLRRNEYLEYIRLFLTAVGALAFVAGFLFDRFKVREQRETDRRVAVASEFNQLHTRTTAALFKKQKNPLLVRLNVEAYRDRMKDTEKQLADSKLDPKKLTDLRAFLADSRDLADHVLAEMPANSEFRQWSEAMDVEAVWQSKADSLAPDLSQLFGASVAAEWGSVREAALSAVRSEYAIFDGSDAEKKAVVYGKAAAEYQRKLYERIR